MALTREELKWAAILALTAVRPIREQESRQSADNG